jgi:hypothetical protein
MQFMAEYELPLTFRIEQINTTLVIIADRIRTSFGSQSGTNCIFFGSGRTRGEQ